MQQVRSWAGHLLACLALLLPVAPAAQAAALYQYTYTSGVLADPGWGDQYQGERFTIGFSLAQPVATDTNGSQALSAWGRIGSAQLLHPRPPPDLEYGPSPFPGDYDWILQPVYPYRDSTFSLYVGSLGTDGLPATWEFNLAEYENVDIYTTFILSLYSRYEGPDVWFNEDVYEGNVRTAGTAARNTVAPGTWAVEVIEVPAPPTLLLSGCAVLMLALARRRTTDNNNHPPQGSKP
ncbi:hypothetical protein [Uliginosibacterium sp. H1]|uniref:hypothetical protein n=1 Tax=Uliginosibacterium sp. H1 TaxID=3114757 RepID=UPI002E17CA08|nr:hypothetical protein [Uliginosibacterium sp. H1]